jgi:ATP-dependent Clp protease ATP-binding subunit ClpC
MSSAAIRHSNALQIAWRLAELEVANLRQPELEPVHFFLGLLKLVELDLNAILGDNSTLSTSQIQDELGHVEQLDRCFQAAGLETTVTRRRLRQTLPRGEAEIKAGQHIRRGSHAREMFALAEQSIRVGTDLVLKPLHLLRSMLHLDCHWISETLETAGVDMGDFEELASVILDGTNAPTERGIEKGGSRKTRNLSPGKGPKRISERLGRDLTELARLGNLSPVIGRKNEMRLLVQTLLRSRKNNAILIGEAGVGKTGIVEGLAMRISEGKVPTEFANKRIVEISMGSLVAGTSLRGDMEARLQALVAEAEADANLILFIDEIHLLIGAGQSSGAMDAANLLKPALSRNGVSLIGATTTAEFNRFIEGDAAFARRFEIIEVSEPDHAEAILILEGLRSGLQSHHGVTITDEALIAAVELTVRHVPDRRLPDKAIDVLDQACAQARMRSISTNLLEHAKLGISIHRQDVAAAVALRCKVPVGDLIADETNTILKLEEILGLRIKGQSRAIATVSQSLRLARSGIGGSGKPMGVFLFVGPTGTGKTELAKALSDAMFGGELGLIRIDMSEMMEAHSVSKLIGSPPGFVGHQEGGLLAKQIRNRPHSVVLLDEMEKAHPLVMDVFLQVLDTGFLTDAQGHRCDFRNSVIIMTSNLGAEGGRTAIGFATSKDEKDATTARNENLKAELRKAFRSEFINRISEIVPFDSLGKEAVSEILRMLIERLNTRLQPKGVMVKVNESAFDLLLEQGYSDQYGARHLERSFEHQLTKPLSLLLLEGKVKSGATVLVELEDNHLQLKFPTDQF